MARSCKTCSDMQPEEEGTGTDRPSHYQCTLYDHMENFSRYKYKQLKKEFSEYLLTKLLTPNPKFTNLEMSSLYSAFEEISDPVDEKSVSQKQSDGSTLPPPELSRVPITCPIYGCNSIVGITSILSHFFQNHESCFPENFTDIYGERKALLAFDHKTIVFGQQSCIGVLVYGGTDNLLETCPAYQGKCCKNAFLPIKYSRFVYHLPVLIMACKTTLAHMIPDKNIVNEIVQSNKETVEVLVIFLATIDTSYPYYGTMTVFDKEMTSSRSTIVQIRNMKDSINHVDFMHKDSNYLILSLGDLENLTNGGESLIEMEIIINEYNKNSTKKFTLIV